MKRVVCLVFCMILLTACSQNLLYKNNEVVAILEDKEIVAEDILTQYPLEEQYIEYYLKEEIIMEEAKKLGITVSDDEIEQLRQMLYPNVEAIENKEYYEYLATKLNLPAEEYLHLWATTYLTRNAYIQQYISKTFAAPSAEENADAWGQKIEDHFDQLYLEYLDREVLKLKR